MYTVLLFYKYVTISDPAAFVAQIKEQAVALGLRGRILVAEEGINGTVEGTTEHAEQFATWLQSTDFLSDMNIKRSEGTGQSFPKLIVKVRNEIVGTRYPKEMADPRTKPAPHLPADELRAMYERGDDFVVIDMRNSYEYESGHFKNSIDPGMESSRELPQVLHKLEPYKHKKVVTVCTGGIRCEKMAAYLLSSGFSDVSQLENGMHTYMEKYPGKDFLGTLYTFDNRVTMDFGGDREVIGTCRHCGVKTEHYENCSYSPCHKHFLICDSCVHAQGRVHCSAACAEKNLVAPR
jgi:UPF0176 protein